MNVSCTKMLYDCVLFYVVVCNYFHMIQATISDAVDCKTSPRHLLCNNDTIAEGCISYDIDAEKVVSELNNIRSITAKGINLFDENNSTLSEEWKPNQINMLRWSDLLAKSAIVYASTCIAAPSDSAERNLENAIVGEAMSWYKKQEGDSEKDGHILIRDIVLKKFEGNIFDFATEFNTARRLGAIGNFIEILLEEYYEVGCGITSEEIEETKVVNYFLICHFGPRREDGDDLTPWHTGAEPCSGCKECDDLTKLCKTSELPDIQNIEPDSTTPAHETSLGPDSSTPANDTSQGPDSSTPANDTSLGPDSSTPANETTLGPDLLDTTDDSASTSSKFIPITRNYFVLFCTVALDVLIKNI